MKSDRILLEHIVESSTRIQKFMAGMSFEEFKLDEKTISAVVRELTIIGEATAGLNEMFREKYPAIPFHKAIGMRNRIVHEYWAVDEDVVWKTCTEDIPQFKKALEKIL
jgi:uncharacterized protein with HEPN domain